MPRPLVPSTFAANGLLAHINTRTLDTPTACAELCLRTAELRTGLTELERTIAEKCTRLASSKWILG